MLAHKPKDRYEDVAQSTAGIVFLGTPHGGTSQAIDAIFLASLAAHMGNGVRSQLLEDIKPGSPMLDDLVHQFAHLARELPIDVFCFFEQHETDWLKPGRPAWLERYLQPKVQLPLRLWKQMWTKH